MLLAAVVAIVEPTVGPASATGIGRRLMALDRDAQASWAGLLGAVLGRLNDPGRNPDIP